MWKFAHDTSSRVHMVESIPVMGFIGATALLAAGMLAVIVLGVVTL